MVIGKGEAACIALAYIQNGILASNNLRDISRYVQKFTIDYITTATIMKDAYCQNLITEDQGNSLWDRMILKRRMLPTHTFTKFLNR